MCLEKNHVVFVRSASAEKSSEACERYNFLFIIFVDRIFTNLFERPFTKVFDAQVPSSANPCVYRAGHAD